MIILEGPDGAGKSTLAKLIQAQYPNYVITHSPGPCPEEFIMVFKERTFWNMEMSKIKEIIVDRVSIVSEVVYGNVLRGESYVHDKEVRDFFITFYQNKHNVMVFCNQEFEAIKKDSGALYLNREDKINFENKVEKNLPAIRSGYIQFFNKLSSIFQDTNYIEINSFNDYIKLFKLLKETQENECERCRNYKIK